jgi:uncharacterized protein YndB with AHSA1/START domain
MTTDLTLTLTRHINASPATVWRCWTDPELLAKWFAPDPVQITTCEVDPKPGGVFNVVMQMPGHDPMVAPAGCVLVADKDARLVWTAALGPGFAPNPPHDTAGDFYLTVDLTMSAEDGGCRYKVKAMHATPAAVQAHEKMGFFEGWGTTTDQLSALAEAQ